MITRLPQDWGKQRLQSWRAQTKLCLHQDSEKKKKKGAVTQQETEPKVPAGVGGSPVEEWVSRDSLQGQGDWLQLSEKVPFDINTLGGPH